MGKQHLLIYGIDYPYCINDIRDAATEPCTELASVRLAVLLADTVIVSGPMTDQDRNWLASINLALKEQVDSCFIYTRTDRISFQSPKRSSLKPNPIYLRKLNGK